MSTVPPTEMRSSKVVLRKVEPADDVALFAATSDPEVVHFMDWPRAVDLAETTKRLQEIDARWLSYRAKNSSG